MELHSDSGSVKTEVITLDQVLEVSPELVIVKNEQCIVLRMKDGKDGKLVLTNSDEIGLKEWALSLRSTHKSTHDLLRKLKKPGKMFIQEEADPLTSTTNTNGN